MWKVTRYIRPALPDLKFDPDNIAQSGLEILRAQRAAVFTIKDPASEAFIADSYKRRVVYGFARQTIVRMGSIESWLLERWPNPGQVDRRPRVETQAGGRPTSGIGGTAHLMETAKHAGRAESTWCNRAEQFRSGFILSDQHQWKQ